MMYGEGRAFARPIGSGGGIQAISTRQVLLFAPLPKPVLVVGERTLKKIHS